MDLSSDEDEYRALRLDVRHHENGKNRCYSAWNLSSFDIGDHEDDHI